MDAFLHMLTIGGYFLMFCAAFGGMVGLGILLIAYFGLK